MQHSKEKLYIQLLDLTAPVDKLKAYEITIPAALSIREITSVDMMYDLIEFVILANAELTFC